ncbi:hypothetical protein B5M42_016885 [Paenibacillus athensensis]|uniref:Uncharacterized protein n=1 Tax=Paenibacillus athensensis TaxID=1967502 RepID=A0A4Y8PRY6_9BACL|nr:hypothetical protein [Paenibacillus athensensis]MCD1260478.1 hypothetical protein [Paenibacillus athensensis]
MKAAKYVVLYVLLLQFLIPYLVPADVLYGYRINYPIFQNNVNNYDVVLQQIKMEIDRDKLKDYVIILGDSVAFSSPGDSQNAINKYMEDFALPSSKPPVRIFNLSMPAMQTGDLYTLLLMLDEFGISTDNLMLNVRYSGFTARNPDPPAVFWLADSLQRLDKPSFERVKNQLEINGKYKEQPNWVLKLHPFLANHVLTHVSLFRYKDVMLQEGKLLYARYVKGEKEQSDAIGDPRSWREKEGLRGFLEKPEYLNGFNPQPFDMSENNPDVYFWDRIIDHQQGTKTLVFLTGVNEELMKPEFDKPGYAANLRAIDAFFAAKPVGYVNLQGRIDEKLFTDHTHYTGEGYKELAKLVWDKWQSMDRTSSGSGEASSKEAK